MIGRHRAALFATSTMTGFGIASWITRTPAVRDELGASIEGMGVVLLGLSIGSMIGILAAGVLVRRLGTRPLIVLGGALPVTGMLLVALLAPAQLAVGVWAGLFLIGFGSGVAEIGLNVEAAAVERQLSRPVVPVLHACFSLGTVLGGAAGIALTAVRTPVLVHLLVATVVMAALAAFAAGNLRPVPRADPAPSAATAPAPRLGAVLTVQVLLIAAITLAMAFAEGAASDWLPLLMTNDHGAPEAVGSLVFTGFALAMFIGRSAGTPLVARFGRARVIRVCAAVGAVGVLLVVVSPDPVLTAAAAGVWGLGIALGFPLAVSAAGDHPTDGDRRVSVVATAGYVAFLAGPPALGFLGEHLGLQPAMLVPAALLVIALLAAPATRTRAQSDVPGRTLPTAAPAPD
ncbi:MFS transporter [Curtobacterium pusillum]|uniref:MFS transporter n=1 Tax=Curtobacterium pusillum TaxID=69373 RepID=A0ABX2M9U4_9MICO|nr:MFS transporter [Curtobacterium pusillum]NUU14805.1 MFS transporter [Curtobacterium pusillum]GLK31647.1 MFS transporter [Curtobacterium pusillum]